MDNIAGYSHFRCAQCVQCVLRWVCPLPQRVHGRCGFARRLSFIECGSPKWRWQLRKSIHPQLGRNKTLAGGSISARGCPQANAQGRSNFKKERKQIMSLKSRYTFIKKYYPNHFFVFLTNKGYMFYGVDKRIIENFCKSKNIINWLQRV